MTDPDVVAESRALREALGRFATHRAWQADGAASALEARLRRLLGPVRLAPAEATSPAGAAPLRVVHWNVLHGNHYERILDTLKRTPALAGADLVSLNEVDWGLARSGNRHVAFDLARELGMHAAWAALFLELEGGSDTSRPLAQATQRESLFGLALLSRFPFGEVRRVDLDTDAAFLFDTERKAGNLVALVAEVLRPGAPFHVVVTHLDVHGGPHTRARQMAQILAALPPGPALLCGDLNTTTFARGNWRRSVRALGVLALAPSQRLRRRLRQPFEPRHRPHEPLFTALAEAGLAIEPFNDAEPSLDLRLHDVREFRTLPRVLRGLGHGLLQRAARRGRHRLDWIAARGFAVAEPPFTRCDLMRGDQPLSDHAPIGCALRDA